MTQQLIMPPRHMFWHEISYAIKASNPKKVWDIDHIINEICRTPENSHHVPDPQKPVSVYGLEVEQLVAFAHHLKERAAAMTESYTVLGVTRRRKQSSIKPILMVGIASYPEPEMRDTAERRRWINLVVEALKARVEANSGRLVSVILHLDEAFAHLHCICVGSTIGSLVRSLHWGFLASDSEPVKSKKGEAYRAGCERIQDWFFESVGSKMGWLRKRGTADSALHSQQTPLLPDNRLSRSQAQRNRQLQLEIEADALRKRNIELEKKAQELAAAQAMHDENVRHFDVDFDEGEKYLAQRIKEIEVAEEMLKRERERVEALKIEYESRKSRIEAEAATMWGVIGEAAEKTKKWQAEVRDQVALEAKVSRIRGYLRPGGAMCSSEVDDVSDIPL